MFLGNFQRSLKLNFLVLKSSDILEFSVIEDHILVMTIDRNYNYRKDYPTKMDLVNQW